MGLTDPGDHGELKEEVKYLSGGFRDEGVFSQYTIVECEDFREGTLNSLQALSGAFFSPNIFFTKLSKYRGEEETLRQLVERATQYNLGVQLFAPDPMAQLGRRSEINVWFKDMSPDWNPDNLPDNTHLSLLTGYKLHMNWNATMRLICSVPESSELESAERFLRNMLDQARLSNCELEILNTSFEEAFDEAPKADLDLFGTGSELDFEFMDDMVEQTESACLFVRDSGRENVLA